MRRKTPPKGGPMMRESSGSGGVRTPQENKQVFSKVFRWRLPDGQTTEPESVEIIGSFTHWQKVALTRDGKQDAWHVTMHHIPGGKTHHYMLLVDGKPTFDKTCDGLAVPHGFQEEQWQLQTDRGPRVLMLFAQTK
ncbi:MAG: glycogen-binding domain-containing protein [Verrucomicrobiales bacterium]|nr:glycogen-binding domain-containing protein [Verrucomicrobiales bacterium]